ATDVWASMGHEEERIKRLRIFSSYQINAELMSLAKPDALFMHCLPAHRGEEVSGEVLDAPNSVVWDEAENRLHTKKALLEILCQYLLHPLFTLSGPVPRRPPPPAETAPSLCRSGGLGCTRLYTTYPQSTHIKSPCNTASIALSCVLDWKIIYILYPVHFTGPGKMPGNGVSFTLFRDFYRHLCTCSTQRSAKRLTDPYSEHHGEPHADRSP